MHVGVALNVSKAVIGSVVFAGTVLLAGSAALAASACPGGGTQKCTFHCSGPITAPVCTEGPPCTCSLGARNPIVNRAAAFARSPQGSTPPAGVTAPTRIIKLPTQSREGGHRR